MPRKLSAVDEEVRRELIVKGAFLVNVEGTVELHSNIPLSDKALEHIMKIDDDAFPIQQTIPERRIIEGVYISDASLILEIAPELHIENRLDPVSIERFELIAEQRALKPVRDR